ncbi:MAG: CoA pyrophosphatase [Candidatus Kapabacteria bacterium]|nr:CoA pyrophosphatase [Candidatus Kapabacteria bacterium]
MQSLKNNINIIDFIKAKLNSELPGREAQIKMAPSINGQLIRGFDAPKNAKQSSVLLLLYPSKDESDLNILFTLRSNNLNSHSGQISFPGGRKEKNETLVETALRETREEIGISTDDIQILGKLSTLYVPPSNAIIYPFVGFLPYPPETKPNQSEVFEVFSVSLKYFLENKFEKQVWNYNGHLMDVPLWNVHNSTPLWGATAMILMEFLTLFER